MYEKVLLWATPAFIVLMLVECLVARVRHLAEYRLADAVTSVSLGALSTYVGHAKVTNTYWYLQAVPELMAVAAQRFESCMPELSHV